MRVAQRRVRYSQPHTSPRPDARTETRPGADARADRTERRPVVRPPAPAPARPSCSRALARRAQRASWTARRSSGTQIFANFWSHRRRKFLSQFAKILGYPKRRAERETPASPATVSKRALRTLCGCASCQAARADDCFGSVSDCLLPRLSASSVARQNSQLRHVVHLVTSEVARADCSDGNASDDQLVLAPQAGTF